MRKKIIKFCKNKDNIYILGLIIIIVVLLTFYLIKRDYEVYFELYMPNDSYGYIKYIPGNKNEFYLYENSYLNIEYMFSDKIDRKINYVISNDDIVDIKNNKIYAKNIGTTTIYVKTDDNIKSNSININVVNYDE